MHRAVLILYTHLINEAVVNEYKKMKNTPDVDAFLAVDNHSRNFPHIHWIEKQILYGEEVNCFFFDEVLHEEMGLPYYPSENRDFGQVMWNNGDYRFFYFKKYFPDYDYYWSFEFDVFCNSSDGSYLGFLEKYKDNNDDLLIKGLRRVEHDGEWAWSRNIEWLYKGVPLYGSLFPVVRLSNGAIDYLYERRMAICHKYNKNESMRWPYCEQFTPTELMNGGFACSNLPEPYIRFKPTFYLNDTRVFEKPDNCLYHPVKIFGKDLLLEASNYRRRIRDLELELKRNKHLSNRLSMYNKYYNLLISQGKIPIIKKYFEKNNIKHVSIYGLTEISKALLPILRDIGVIIDYAVEEYRIDKEIMVISRNAEEYPATDCMIICDLRLSIIKKKLKKMKLPFKVMDMYEIMGEHIEYNENVLY